MATLEERLAEATALLRECLGERADGTPILTADLVEDVGQLQERPHKRPVLHIHASNDTMPAKPKAHTAHAIVSTVDQADALRGGMYSSVKVHASELWTDDPNGLLGYLVRDVLAPMGIKITTPSNVAGAARGLA